MTAQDRNIIAINRMVCTVIDTICRNVGACGSVRQVQWANTFRVTSDEVLLPAFNKSHVSRLQVWNRKGIEIAEVNIEFNRFETQPHAEYAKLWMTRRRQERHGCFLSNRRMLNLAMHPIEMPSQLKWLTNMIQEEVEFMRNSDVDPTTIYLTPEKILLLESLQQQPAPEQSPGSIASLSICTTEQVTGSRHPMSPPPVYSGSLSATSSVDADDTTTAPPQAAPQLNRSDSSCAITPLPRKRKVAPSQQSTIIVVEASACSQLLPWAKLHRRSGETP
jgi:hypothetical protein